MVTSIDVTNSSAVALAHVTDETEQANPDESLRYAECNFGSATTLQYNCSEFEDRNGFHLVTSLHDENWDTIYKDIVRLAPNEAHEILESYGGWDYTE